mmetsp:Transcript_12947/g.40106  ORF Transcript_12947/g.40106 Transcript_12947/m.40106 type:complete len:219 (+) Transcript_12947:151-807(+)
MLALVASNADPLCNEEVMLAPVASIMGPLSGVIPCTGLTEAGRVHCTKGGRIKWAARGKTALDHAIRVALLAPVLVERGRATRLWASPRNWCCHRLDLHDVPNGLGTLLLPAAPILPSGCLGFCTVRCGARGVSPRQAISPRRPWGAVVRVACLALGGGDEAASCDDPVEVTVAGDDARCVDAEPGEERVEARRWHVLQDGVRGWIHEPEEWQLRPVG